MSKGRRSILESLVRFDYGKLAHRLLTFDFKTFDS
jgi:hypothetical protein